MSRVKVTIMMLLMATIALVMASQAFATTASISATADSTIYEWRDTVGEGWGASDYAYGYDDALKVRYYNHGDSHKTYIKFTLPADFSSATDAAVKLFYLSGNHNAVELNIYGLKDNASGQDWAEGSGSHQGDPPSDGLTWNNAPGNDTASENGFNSDATGVLATAREPDTNNTFVTFSSQALTDFINTDTDKVITFMLAGGEKTTNDPNFASRENTSHDGPVLELTYTPVPEPASIIILSSLVSLAARKRF